MHNIVTQLLGIRMGYGMMKTAQNAQLNKQLNTYSLTFLYGCSYRSLYAYSTSTKKP